LITVYIVRCSDGLYYTGQTNNLERRLKEHNAGTGGWTSYHCPVTLIHSFTCPTRIHARCIEKKIKAQGAKKYLMQLALDKSNPGILCGIL
jgi:predicted GIY-YIG superfamily endonuclease